MRRRLLLAAYACEPGRGSEPGIGWNVATGLAAHHDVWVLTRTSNVEALAAAEHVPGLRMAPFELDAAPLARLQESGWGMQVHYYLWQRAAARAAEALHRQVRFHATQHVTFNRYWMPSAAALEGVPFLWGPVGGGEGVPAALSRTANPAFEALRSVTRAAGELDPMVRRTAERATIALATTGESAERMRRLGAADVRVLPAVALSDAEVKQLTALELPEAQAPVRFLSIGRLLAWKGFHLGLQAFARAVAAEPALRTAEYWILGDGPESGRLRRMAEALHLGERVRFLGAVPRPEVLARFAQAHALVHPSLHDSGGFVCLEALAAGRPVLCLDAGGPAALTPRTAGVLAPPTSPRAAIEALAEGMIALATSRRHLETMGEAGRAHVVAHHRWSIRTQQYARLHETLTRAPVPEMRLPVAA